MKITWQTPSNFVRSVSVNLWWLLRGRKVFASKEVIAQRDAICTGCIFFDASSGQCLDCTCFKDLKIQFKAERCPQDFW